MGLKDWSAKRILGIWTGWMSGLLLALLGALVVNPTGVTLRMAAGDAPVAVRIGLAALGLVAICLPPAILTYAWYLKRVRAWGEGWREEEAQTLADTYTHMLSEGEARPLRQEPAARSHARRPDSPTSR
ncbi:MAG: hypothetical protein AB1762_01340 [Gemmatimonadota bacterium]